MDTKTTPAWALRRLAAACRKCLAALDRDTPHLTAVQAQHEALVDALPADVGWLNTATTLDALAARAEAAEARVADDLAAYQRLGAHYTTMESRAENAERALVRLEAECADHRAAADAAEARVADLEAMLRGVGDRLRGEPVAFQHISHDGLLDVASKVDSYAADLLTTHPATDRSTP